MNSYAMKDIENRQDVELLVDEFYKKVVKDKVIGHFFTEVIVLDLEKHLPVMYDFWETHLLGNMIYKGNPMTKHILLNEKSPITPIHFNHWLELWQETLSANFNGPMADEALSRAQQIASLMQFKIVQQKK